MREESDRAVRPVRGWDREVRDCCSLGVAQSGAAAVVVGTAHAAFGGVVGSRSYGAAEDAQGLEVREEVEAGMLVEVHLGRGERFVGS